MKLEQSDCNITDFGTWRIDNSEKVFRYWVYKRVFTPYEVDQKFIDETEFTDTHCQYGIIEDAMALPDGDILIGFSHPEFRHKYIEYFKLSEIRLAYSDDDQDDPDVIAGLREEEDDEES